MDSNVESLLHAETARRLAQGRYLDVCNGDMTEAGVTLETFVACLPEHRFLPSRLVRLLPSADGLMVLGAVLMFIKYERNKAFSSSAASSIMRKSKNWIKRFRRDEV